MYQPRRASLPVSVERPAATAFEGGPRRAARRPGSALLSKAVPTVVSLGVLVGAGGVALTADAAQGEVPATSAVPAPVRGQDSTSRSEDRAALVATTELGEGAAGATPQASDATPQAAADAFVVGAWSDSFGAPSGTRFTQEAVEVRATAAGDAAVLATLSKGTEVKVNDKVVDGWTQVASGTKIGWVRTQQLGAKAPGPVVATPAARTEPAAASGGRLARPAQGSLGSPWGMRMHPILKYKRMHGGVDIGGRTGQPIYAAEDGVVTTAASGYNGGSGNNIRIDHGRLAGKAVETAYLHLHTISVRAGQKVKRGQVIGTMGSTGLSTGPHLHFSLYLNGANADPAPWLR